MTSRTSRGGETDVSDASLKVQGRTVRGTVVPERRSPCSPMCARTRRKSRNGGTPGPKMPLRTVWAASGTSREIGANRVADSAQIGVIGRVCMGNGKSPATYHDGRVPKGHCSLMSCRRVPRRLGPRRSYRLLSHPVPGPALDCWPRQRPWRLKSAATSVRWARRAGWPDHRWTPLPSGPLCPIELYRRRPQTPPRIA
jgi:hypothetical protein